MTQAEASTMAHTKEFDTLTLGEFFLSVCLFCLSVCLSARFFLLKAYTLYFYSPVNRTGSPQGFSLNQILQKLNSIQKSQETERSLS